MKNFNLILILIVTFAFINPSFGENPNDKWSPSWGVPDYNPSSQPAGEDSEQVWDTERENVIKNNFGSDSSPEYLNTKESSDNEYNETDNGNSDFEQQPYQGGD